MKSPSAVRSQLMARVRQKGTAAELAVGAVLRRLGQCYRLNVRALPGSPDFANRSRKWAFFVHGCFWHRHPGCRRATMPKTNRQFWRSKFEANQKRDRRAIRLLKRIGFRVVTVWECETDRPDAVERKLSKVFEPRRINMR